MSEVVIEKPRTGFTLIEVLVVLAIVGLAWFSFLPNLDMSRRQDSFKSELEKLNTCMHGLRQKALNENKSLHLEIEANRIVSREGDCPVPSTVIQTEVGDESRLGFRNAGSFLLYSDGHSDRVKLWLSNGKVLFLRIVTAQFEVR